MSILNLTAWYLRCMTAVWNSQIRLLKKCRSIFRTSHIKLWFPAVSNLQKRRVTANRLSIMKNTAKQASLIKSSLMRLWKDNNEKHLFFKCFRISKYYWKTFILIFSNISYCNNNMYFNYFITCNFLVAIGFILWLILFIIIKRAFNKIYERMCSYQIDATVDNIYVNEFKMFGTNSYNINLCIDYEYNGKITDELWSFITVLI